MEGIYFTIVTVCYNSEKTIERTLKSVLSQEYQKYEYIIVDGGSRDSTIDIVKTYDSPKLRWISEPDHGIYDAMNKGIRMAKGKYIWLVNSDDWIEPGILTMLYEIVKEKDADIITGYSNIVDIDGKVRTIDKSNRQTFEKRIKSLKMGLSHPATIVAKSVYNKIGLYDDRYYISADIDFIIRAYRQGVSFLFLDSVLTNMENAGISNRLPLKKCIHDWHLRFSKFTPNKFLYVTNMLDMLTIVLIRKLIPEKYFYIILNFRKIFKLNSND